MATEKTTIELIIARVNPAPPRIPDDPGWRHPFDVFRPGERW